MESYIERMIKELEELDGRIQRLEDYLPKLERHTEVAGLMAIQLNHMRKYREVLNKRIELATANK